MTNSKKPYRKLLIDTTFSWRSYAIYASATVPSVLLRLDLEALELHIALKALLVGSLLTLFISPIAWWGFFILEKIKERRVTHPALPFFIIALFGTIRGALLQYTFALQNLPDTLSLLASIASSTIFTLVLFTASSFIVALTHFPASRFREEFSLATLNRLRSHGHDESLLSEYTYTESMKSMKFAIDQHLPLDRAEQPTDSAVLAAASEIRKQIQEVIRPLSHRLWIDNFGEIEKIKITEYLVESIKRPQFKINYVLGLQFTLGLLGITLFSSFDEAAIASVAGTATTALIILIFRKISNTTEGNFLFTGISFLVCLGIFPVFVGVWSHVHALTVSSLVEGLLIAPVLPSCVLFSSLYRSIYEDKEFAVTAAKSVRLQQFSQTDSFSESLDSIALAGYLHNSLQSELLRISLQLENSSPSNSESKWVQSYENLTAVLNRSLADVKRIQEEGLERLYRIVDSWIGIADIRLVMAPNLSVHSDRESILVELVEELITNSIRHGQARLIEIEISSSESELFVKLSHDGDAIVLEGSGLGSLWIAQNSIDIPRIVTESNTSIYALKN
jgi:signal transduction histidine kinase